MRLNPETIARASSRHPWRTVAAWSILIVVMGTLSGTLLKGALTTNIAFTNKPDSAKAQDVIDAKFSRASSKNSEYVIVTSTGATTADPAFVTQVSAIASDLQGLGASIVSGPPFTYVQAQAQAKALLPPGGHSVLIPIVPAAGVGPDQLLTTVRSAVAGAAPKGFEAKVITPTSPGGTSGTAPSPAGFVLVSSTSTPVTDPAFGQAVHEVENAVIGAAGTSLASAPTSGLDAQGFATQLASSDGKSTMIVVPIAGQTDKVVQALRGVAAAHSTGGFTAQVAGSASLQSDFQKISEQDIARGDRIGLLVAVIVLVVVFGAIVAALLPIGMGMFSISVALGLVAILGQFFKFSFFVTSMVTMIGLAVGIDYSLFIVSRYREERRKGFEKMDAIGAAGATANRAVFFSGMTVVLALLGMFIIPTTIFRSLAGGAILVTLSAVAASMTLLPALLALLGDRINWPRLSKRAHVDGEHDPRGGFWDRLTSSVMAKPVIFLTVSVLILGGLGAFYFQLKRGNSQSVATLPDEMQSKQAFLTLEQKFAGGVTNPVQIVLSGDAKSPQVQAAVDSLKSAIAADPRFSGAISQVTPSLDGRALMVQAYFKGDPQSEEAFKAVQDLRESAVPAAAALAPGTQINVGGQTAGYVDFLHVSDQYQWLVLIFVLGLSFILLTVVFRSIVVPIKAIIMNLLSVAAAYGAVTLVFQKGVGIGVFNAIGFQFHRSPVIEAWLPLFLFSILFGLSMDYHVFLLTRIREEYDRTHDNTESVAYGLRTTAGIITGAAIIMVVVFTAFASGRLGPLQQMGFGLAVAVFMDATIVRTLLVPASMRLLGDANWYLPSWLEWLPKLNVEGHEPEAVQAFPRVAELADSGAE
jgi:RND superfamily putative drug exporter